MLHYVVHVVRYDRCVSVHHPGKYVGVYVGCFLCLFELDFHVFQKVFIECFPFRLYVFKALKEHEVAVYGCYEKHEAFFYVKKRLEFAVFNGAFQFFFCTFYLYVQLFQVFEKPHRRREEKPQHQVVFVGKSPVFTLVVANEIRYHVVLVVTKRYDDITAQDYA